ncbi:S-adenosyl-L-methionine-dependent methyltransferase [Auriculariales sp. MPI-PUGE-AT-0066]|nr:S-adenosyl-L-methionine-dependent methyltransferase [Auriculariales sp. MPI-PUGE-AT-0066]
MLNSLYPCDPTVVDGVLSHADSFVLDLGSGSGIWAAQMAFEFPNATVVGVDTSHSAPLNVPNNCFFESHNISHGLARYYARFDLVHCRCVAGVVPNHNVLVDELVKCLRPGGLIILGEGDLRVYTEHKILAPMRRSDEDVDPSHSWLARYLYELDAHSSASTIGWHLATLLTRTGAFPAASGVTTKQLYVPIGWEGDASMAPEVGELMKRNCQDFVRSWKSKLLQKGFPPLQVDFWIRKVDQEIGVAAADTGDSNVLRLCNVWHYTWAVMPSDGLLIA